MAPQADDPEFDTKLERYQVYARNGKWIADEVCKYESIINHLVSLNKPFSFNRVFELVSNPKEKEAVSVFNFFKAHIQSLKDQEKCGNARTYQGTLNKFKKFQRNKDLIFPELDVDVLVSFKRSMAKQKLGVS